MREEIELHELKGFREGDKEIFQKVYNSTVKPLIYFVQNIVHSELEAEEIVANGFYKLFLARESMKSLEHIKRWLYVTCRHEAIDHLRLKARAKTFNNEIKYLSEDIDEMAETERVKTMLLQEIQNEINRLPPQRRMIIKMYYFEGLGTHEIAARTNLSPQTVLNHKTKALEKLRTGPLRKLSEGALATLLLGIVASEFIDAICRECLTV